MSLSVLFKHTSSRAAGDAGRAFELGSAEWKCSLTVEGPARPGREHPSGGGGRTATECEDFGAGRKRGAVTVTQGTWGRASGSTRRGWSSKASADRTHPTVLKPSGPVAHTVDWVSKVDRRRLGTVTLGWAGPAVPA